MHAKVIRPYSHSLSDDEVMYRPTAEREADAARDPLTTFPAWLLEEGYVTEADLAKMREEVEAEVLAATDDALAQPQPDASTVHFAVYSPDVDPTSEQFDTEDDPQFSGEPTTMVDLLNSCMKDEMRRDPKILMFGEDVADVSREEQLGKVKGKGGVFKVTWGLQKEFGGSRVYNTPLAEANIVGRAIGLAARGFKPVVEVQFFDYIWPAYMQLRDELATMRWRSNNDVLDARSWSARRTADTSAARSTIRRRARRCSRIARDCAWCARRRRSTRTACCARRFAATIR